MKYNLDSVTKFGNTIKDMLTRRSIDMIDKYKESASQSTFAKKVENNDNKETDWSITFW